MPFSFENLDVYQKSLSFVEAIENLITELKGKISYSSQDQLSRAALSILLNIAEGNGQAKKLDGISLIFSNTKISMDEIVKGYFDKDVVEKSFQALKGVVNLRPVRHWLYNRVEAHVFICYLACLLLSVLKDKVRHLEISPIKAIQDLDGLYRVYLRDPKSGYKLGKLVALTKNQEKILAAVNKHLLKSL